VAGGWRAGKSLTGAREAILKAADPRNKLGWIVAPTYATPRGAEWDYIIQDLQTLGFLRDYSTNREGSLTADTEAGCHIETKSATDPKTLGGQAPNFIIVCEAAQLEYEIYLWLLGRIAEKRASLIMTGTFEDYSGWYNDFFTKWQIPNEDDGASFSLPTWSNIKIFPGGRNDEEILKLEASNPPDFFKQRYAGVPCKPANLVMAEFSVPIHVGEYEFNPDNPVEIAVDPGYAGAHAVLAIQKLESQIAVIDEVYLQGYTTEEIIEICKQKLWWGKVISGAIDIAGKQHQAMEAPVAVWQEKAGIYLACQSVPVEDGINLMRSLLLSPPPLYKPKLVFNHKCHGIISEMGGCKSPVQGGGLWLRDENKLKQKYKNDHACKALIYYLVNTVGYTVQPTPLNLEVWRI
jgi:hypothetical protein